MSDFLRGNHNNTNSPFFVAKVIEISYDELFVFVEYNMEDEVLDHFLDNCSEEMSDQYTGVWLDDFPEKLCDDAVTDYIANCPETARLAYLNLR